MDPVESTVASPPRLMTRRRVLLCAAVLAVLAVPVLYVFGPQVETNLKCPLTGRDRVVIERCGLTFTDKVTPNEVSAWAEPNSIAGVVPGQCGWEFASTVRTEWFSPPLFGCGQTFMIPYRLQQGSISLPGLTKVEALREYQTAIQTAFAAGGSQVAAMQKFLESAEAE